MNKALRSITNEFSHPMTEDEKFIDYGSVGLYLTGLQVAATIVICACASVLSCWMIPPDAISAVRTLAITTGLGLVLVRKPIRIGRVRGVNTIFNALRPAVPIYILALVVEQLVHTCVTLQEAEHATLRRVVYHLMASIMIISAFARARSPKSESDIPFALTAVCTLVIAVLPPTALSRSGPLCEPSTLVQAGERTLRAFLFACVYIVHVYAAAPSRNISNELFICVARASAASVWILCASAWTLPLGPFQVAVVLFSRLGEEDVTTNSENDVYSSVPLKGVHVADHSTEIAEDHHTPMGGTMSDVESGDIGAMASCAEFLNIAPKLPSITNAIRVSTPRSGNTLSFSFAGTAQAMPVNVAAVIARESRSEQ